MMISRACIAVILVSALTGNRLAAETGKKSDLSVQDNSTVLIMQGEVGMDIDATWHSASWDAGSNETGTGIAAGAALFYGINNHLDVRLAARYLSLDGDDDNLDVLRVGAGARLWLPTGRDFAPYLTGIVSVYSLNSDVVNSLASAAGISGELGIAYIASDFLLIEACIQAETLFSDASGEIGDTDEDVPFSSIGFGIGLSATF